MVDTLAGASKADIAKATIIGVFILIGMVVSVGAFTCTDACPVFTQVHFDRFVDLVMFVGFGGAIYVGIKAVTQGQRNTIVDNKKIN